MGENEQTKKKRGMFVNERLLRRKLLDYLKEHGHPRYALFLKKFDVIIVPWQEDPTFAAAIDIDGRNIYISNGVISDDQMPQLDMLIRHELAHALLKHNIRLLSKLDFDTFDLTVTSLSIHKLMNIIEDDEISNVIYSDADKDIVRHVFINGQVISGLVTEDHRQSWLGLSLEKMYDKLMEEIDTVHNDLINNGYVRNDSDYIKSTILGELFTYTDTTSESFIGGDLDKLIKNGYTLSINGKKEKLKEPFQKIIKTVYDRYQAAPWSDADTKKLLEDLAKAHPMTPFDLISPTTGEIIITVRSPEDKCFLNAVLKKLRNDYDTWFDAVYGTLSSGKYYRWDIQDVCQRCLSKKN